jgi:YjbE family integral membrane protein
LELSASLDVVGPVLQISLIDLLLSGDNAILIALACRGLPADVRRNAVILGTGAAVVFRVLMIFTATLLLRLPYFKLAGAVLLLLIAIELLAGDGTDRGKAAAGSNAGAGIWRAVVLVVVADAVMSLDNVVAIAAAAQDSVLLLIFGLLLSVPILVFSSLYVVHLLATHPLLVQGGAALLGWIAGRTAVEDPAIASFLETQSFGVVALAPVLGAAYVLLQGRLLRQRRAGQPTAEPVAAAAPGDKPVAVEEAVLTEAAQAPTAPAAEAVPARAAAEPADPPVAEAPAAVRRFSAMDLTIMAGVAVPALGLVATLVYIIGKLLASHH